MLYRDGKAIGGGPGGCTAALYAARAGLETLVLEKMSANGAVAVHFAEEYLSQSH